MGMINTKLERMLLLGERTGNRIEEGNWGSNYSCAV